MKITKLTLEQLNDRATRLRALLQATEYQIITLRLDAIVADRQQQRAEATR